MSDAQEHGTDVVVAALAAGKVDQSLGQDRGVWLWSPGAIPCPIYIQICSRSRSFGRMQDLPQLLWLWRIVPKPVATEQHITRVQQFAANKLGWVLVQVRIGSEPPRETMGRVAMVLAQLTAALGRQPIGTTVAEPADSQLAIANHRHHNCGCWSICFPWGEVGHGLLGLIERLPQAAYQEAIKGLGQNYLCLELFLKRVLRRRLQRCLQRRLQRFTHRRRCQLRGLFGTG